MRNLIRCRVRYPEFALCQLRVCLSEVRKSEGHLYFTLIMFSFFLTVVMVIGVVVVKSKFL